MMIPEVEESFEKEKFESAIIVGIEVCSSRLSIIDESTLSYSHTFASCRPLSTSYVGESPLMS